MPLADPLYWPLTRTLMGHQMKAGDLHRIHWVQTFTIIWMFVELVVSCIAAATAHSPSLLAFGGDSGIELLSAAVVLWRFRSPSMHERAEKRAAQIAAGLLFLLAAFVVATSLASLLGYGEARSSPLGIVLLLAAGLVMPWLANQKRKLSAAATSAALRADAAQSALCGYMAWIALAGVILNAVWGFRWADPIAALALVPIIVREASESAKGKACAC